MYIVCVSIEFYLSECKKDIGPIYHKESVYNWCVTITFYFVIVLLRLQHINLTQLGFPKWLIRG
jgi:hypothetical protein